VYLIAHPTSATNKLIANYLLTTDYYPVKGMNA
jgi:hypothetical protein